MYPLLSLSAGTSQKKLIAKAPFSQTVLGSLSDVGRNDVFERIIDIDRTRSIDYPLRQPNFSIADIA